MSKSLPEARALTDEVHEWVEEAYPAIEERAEEEGAFMDRLARRWISDSPVL